MPWTVLGAGYSMDKSEKVPITGGGACQMQQRDKPTCIQRQFML